MCLDIVFFLRHTISITWKGKVDLFAGEQHSKKVPGLNPSRAEGLSVQSLHILPLSGFPSWSETKHVKESTVNGPYSRCED